MAQRRAEDKYREGKMMSRETKKGKKNILYELHFSCDDSSIKRKVWGNLQTVCVQTSLPAFRFDQSAQLFQSWRQMQVYSCRFF